MKLVIVRHGQAVGKAAGGERPLSDEGKEEVRRMAAFLAGKIQCPEIWHSTKLRAIQTALIFQEAGVGKTLVERKDLNPLDPVNPLVRDMNARSESLMVVGHLPFVRDLTLALLDSGGTGDWLNFTTARVVVLRRNERWILRDSIHPGLLSKS